MRVKVLLTSQLEFDQEDHSNLVTISSSFKFLFVNCQFELFGFEVIYNPFQSPESLTLENPKVKFLL